MIIEQDTRDTIFQLKKQIEDYNVMIDGKNFIEQPIKNDIKTYENIPKVATG